ncbi:hypothetical protein D3C85_1363430 [compost metagenome]
MFDLTLLDTYELAPSIHKDAGCILAYTPCRMNDTTTSPSKPGSFGSHEAAPANYEDSPPLRYQSGSFL